MQQYSTVIDEISDRVFVLQCRNPQCTHSWKYRGHSKHWAICPFCRKVVHTVRDRAEIKESNLDPGVQTKDQIASSMKVEGGPL